METIPRASATGVGALNANEYDDRVNVNRYEPENIVQSFERNGGRAAEVVRPQEDTLCGVFSFGIKPQSFPCIFSPVADHAANFTKTFLSVPKSFFLINAEIVNEPHENLHEIKSTLQVIKQCQPFGKR